MTVNGASQILSSRAFDVLEYLDISKTPEPFRVIMTRCNITCEHLTYYVKKLKQHYFIKSLQDARSTYRITDRGVSVMRSLRDIEKELDFLEKMPAEQEFRKTNEVNNQ